MIPLILACVATCANRPTSPTLSSTGSLPPNVATFTAPYEDVWEALVKTVQYELLFPLEIASPKAGLLSTKVMREKVKGKVFRYRLSGNLSLTDSGVAVNLYNHRELLVDGRWRALPSDYELEARVLKLVREKLDTAPP